MGALSGKVAIVTGGGTGIGRGVAFLVGPDAAYLTGATIPLDGGSS